MPADHDQATISAPAAIALALAVLAGAGAMLALRTQPVGVGFMLLYAGASLFAAFVIVRSDAGIAPRMLLIPLLVAANFALVIAGDPFGMRGTTSALDVVNAPVPEETPRPARDPATAEEMVETIHAQADAPGRADVRLSVVAGDPDTIDWWITLDGVERRCGRFTMWGGSRVAQAAVIAAAIRRARLESRDAPSCGELRDLRKAD